MTETLYAIGDVHGCLPSLQRIVSMIPRDARLLFLGDTVNRGPASLETLRYIRTLQDRSVYLLGNHEMHLLAAYALHAKQHYRDTIEPILEAPDAKELIRFVRSWKLLHRDGDTLFVHAGLHPAWTVDEAQELAAEAEGVIRGDKWKKFFKHMYGGTQWNPKLKGDDRTRAIINCFTRIRNVTEDGFQMDYKGFWKPEKGSGQLPWFEVPGRPSQDTTIVFGHWSVTGLIDRPNLVALDLACLWGGTLAAMRFPDRRLLVDQTTPYASPV